MQDVFNKYNGGQNLTCTAEDVRIAAVAIPSTPPDGCDFVGDTTTFDAILTVFLGAQARHDIGVYMSMDGGDALNGSCLISTPPYQPANNAGACLGANDPFPCCTGPGTGSTCGYTDLDGTGDTGMACSGADTQPCNDNGDCTGSVPVCTASLTPFTCCTGAGTGACGNCVNVGPGLQDLCGDIDASPNPIYYKITGITLTCVDTDGDGFLDVNACTSWRQPGANDLCRSPLAAFPGSPSKCKCQTTLKIPISVPRTIKVCKAFTPASDPGLANLRIDGTTHFADASDGDCTGHEMVSIGSHSVSETAGSTFGSYNTNISCLDYAGRCTGNSSYSCLVDATCTALSAGTCDLTPTKVANCTNCNTLAVSVSSMATKIVCTITNINCDDCNDCTIDSVNGATCVHTPVSAGTACIPRTGSAGVCSSTQDTFACTNEACNASGACISTPNDAKCNDFNECTFNDCDPNAVGHDADGCVYPPVADFTPCTADAIPCTDDVCQAGVCTHNPDDGNCDDMATCTGDKCLPGPGADANGCVFNPNNAVCDDGVGCTNDSCDPAHPAANPGTGCVNLADDGKCPDDGMFCNGTTYCDSAAGCVITGDPCFGTPTPLCCEVTDTCVAQCCSDADCPDDGQFCNGSEVCVAGVCGHTGNPCSEDSCDCTKVTCEESNDKCVKSVDPAYSCDNGIFCDGDEYCDLSAAGPGTCCVSPGNPCQSPLQCNEIKDMCVGCLSDDKCPDNIFCDGVETCDETTQTCTTSGPNPCPEDNIACTHISCNENTDMCVTTLDDSVCNDGIACTSDVCDPTNPLANPTTGCINTPVNAVCNDVNVCTNDSCVPTSCTPPCSGCVFAPKSAGFACGNQTLKGVCDNPDVCDAFGNCTQNPKPAGTLCRAGGLCDPPEFCDGTGKDCPANACTTTGTACTDDGNECTVDACDGNCHCAHTPKPDQTACSSDGNVCTKDVCMGGTCVHTPEPVSVPCGNQTPQGDCDGPDHCNGMGGCDPNLSLPGTICRMAVNECDLTEVCTGTSSACPPDGCKSGTAACSSDGNECTNDVCNGVCGPGVACTHPPLPDGTSCGNPISQGVCDTPDECKGGMCTPQYEPSTTICRPAASDCDVDDYCTGDDADCPPDECVAMGTPCSSDNDQCTDDVCNGSCGCTHDKNGICGACCDHSVVDGGCTDQVPPQDCTSDQMQHFPGETCADISCDEHTGACCDEDSFGSCQSNVPASQCNCKKCVFYKDTPCDEIVCMHKAIPTMSQWGLAVLSLLLLIGAKVYFGRRQVDVA